MIALSRTAFEDLVPCDDWFRFFRIARVEKHVPLVAEDLPF
jgi:hypothetical protein